MGQLTCIENFGHFVKQEPSIILRNEGLLYRKQNPRRVGSLVKSSNPPKGCPAVRLANERGNLCAVARDLGVHESVSGRWKRSLADESRSPVTAERSLPAFPAPVGYPGNPRDEELARLQKENRCLREENEILENRVPAAGGGIFTSRPT